MVSAIFPNLAWPGRVFSESCFQKLSPLLYGIVIFVVECSHSHTESSFLLPLRKCAHSCTKSSFFFPNSPTLARNRRFCFSIFFGFFSRVGFCYKNVTTPARNRHFFMNNSHSRTESSFLFLIQKSHHSLTKSSLFCQTAPTLIRNRRFCVLKLP